MCAKNISAIEVKKQWCLKITSTTFYLEIQVHEIIFLYNLCNPFLCTIIMVKANKSFT